jgi:hypothetical protein
MSRIARRKTAYATLVASAAIAWLSGNASAQTEGLKRPTVEIAVSPRGNDQSSGTVAQPFRTLERARVAVRAASSVSDVVVRIAEGTYRLVAPLRLSEADGGRNGFHVTWTAATGARPEISGAIEITDWNIYDAAREIYVADVPKGIASRQLWVNDALAERAMIEIPRAGVTFSREGITLDDPAFAYLATLPAQDRIEIRGLGHFTLRFSPVSRIEGNKLVMQQPAWLNNVWGYDSIAHPYIPKDGRLFLVNSLAFLTKPGQWYLDSDKGRLYYRPRKGENPRTLRAELPRIASLLQIGGRYDDPVRDLTISGLRFSHTSWLGPSSPQGYANQQSGSFLFGLAPNYPADPLVTCRWGCREFETQRNEWHQTPAAVQISASEGVRIDNNVFAHLGQYALGIGNNPEAHGSGIGLGAVDTVVTRNIFTDLAGGAIVAGGINRDAHHPSDPRMTNRQLTIRNNLIQSVSKDYWDNTAILSTYFSGALILHNDISDVPYDAIDTGFGWGMHDPGGNPNYRTRQEGYAFRGNLVYDTPTIQRDVVVAYNRIYKAKTWFEDGGAYYNQSASPGGIVAENHIFDIGPHVALYLDEGSRYVTIRNNVVEDAGYWLKANTLDVALPLRTTIDNKIVGNWHNTMRTEGTFENYLNNIISDDRPVGDGKWTPQAYAVMSAAGIEASAGDVSYGTVSARPKTGAAK